MKTGRLLSVHSLLSRTPATCAVLSVVLALMAVPGRAQTPNVALFVNGDPITNYDIEQRTKFTLMASRKAATRTEVIDELIDEKLKIQIGKRYQLDLTDKELNTSYEEMAKRMRLNGDQLTKMLAQNGIGPETLKSRIRADIVWQQIIRGKFQQSLQIREKDVLEVIEQKNEGASTTASEYTLRPILFVVPRGAGSAVVDGRKREAEALRARFQNCDEGLPFARAIRDVAVRGQIVKLSADLPAPLREILDGTPVGKLTAPEVTQHGVEVFAVCSKKETTVDSLAKKTAREEMFAKRFQSKATAYLKELRKGAMIERIQ